MTLRQQFGVFALVCILAASMAGGPKGGGDGSARVAGDLGAAQPSMAVRPPPPIVVKMTPKVTLTPEQEIKLVGNKWARPFAVGDNAGVCRNSEAVRYMGQPACEAVACKRASGQKIRGCTPLSESVQRSFEDATVQEVVIKGRRVAARFSNGQVVEFVGPGRDHRWLIDKVGGSAGRGLLK